MLAPSMLLVAVGLFLGADAADEATKKDRAAFEGEWKVLTLEISGEKSANERKVWFEGEKIFLEADGEKKEVGTFRLDASVTPKIMDVKPTEGDALEGIYELKDGKLSMAFVMKGAARPANFDATQTNIVATLEKAK